jgi:N-acetylglucosaminyl-diphospho-decaprenol L-rhamnosyltransferase
MSDSVPDVTVVVIVFDTEPALLEQCLASAEQVSAHSEHGIEVIVVDNSPHDSLRSRFSARATRWLYGHGNIGFARAANLGTIQAAGRRVLFLNPDAALNSSSIDALQQAVDSAPPNSLFCGWLVNNGGVQVDAYLHWWTSVGRLLRRSAYRDYLNASVTADLVPVQKVSGGALFGPSMNDSSFTGRTPTCPRGLGRRATGFGRCRRRQ